GRIFDRVRSDPKLRDNTIIIVASDNGPEGGLGTTGGLRGSKGMLWEGGIREPFIVWSPSRIAKDKVGSTNETTVLAGMDLAPTVLSLAGIKEPAEAKPDGLDMSDAFVGKTAPVRESPIMWVRPPDRPGPHKGWPDLAIREGNWKLLVFRDGSRPELFDLSNDVAEKHNLAKEHPDMVDRLSKEVIAWEKQVTPAS